MEIANIKVGPIQTNCYIVVDGGEAMVVDPGAQGDRIVAELNKMGAPKLRYVVLTHGHWDHIGGVPAIIEGTGARLLCHKDDLYRLSDARNLSKLEPQAAACFAGGKVSGVTPEPISQGDTVTVGSKAFKVICTPGHTAGSVCLYCAEEGVLFAGDTLFAGGRYGRTDFEGGSMDDMIDTLSSKFIYVDDDAVVFSGHDKSSTMRAERQLNPYLR